jgi:hypothetical protein
MPLSDTERRTLTRMVGRCRRRLEDEAHDQLERVYGFTRDGAARALAGLSLSSIELGVAEQLREWHRHLASVANGEPAQRQLAALRKMAEETAFTVLHRLAAIRMAEERGVLRPCLRDGFRSDSFRLYLQFSGGALGREEEAYRLFLERVFDEIAQDLPTLFDRREPRSLIFPRAKCLEDVVVELTVADLSRAWQDDEAIGWVYQDFHPANERRELRRGNDVPRDSTDLAIRNQLFTPRWVVEFLTDNTLGRLWVEMTDGETEIADDCAYLLRADVASRVAPKDVRDVRVLDPACGSGHFLLYAFDLLERIYREAWDRRIGISPDRKPLWVECPDREAFLREVPMLILRHNLFGLDIDPRPIQVAALALWLRAQRSWKDIPRHERPRIARMNLVCAEPMPGDREQLDAFASGLRPAVLGELVREVWEAMRPVDETGLLLRIDERIRTIIGEARDRWNGTTGPVQSSLFEETPNWPGRRHDLSDLAQDEAARFWSVAEERVVQALSGYAAQATEDERVLRRLFAEDAERGFAFIDLSRARYDVVLMNPPFGQPAESTKDALDEAYPACGHEIYAMFFQRALELLETHGRVGAITSRAWLALKLSRGLRETILEDRGAVTLGADLGYGVLEAKVETCAVVIDRRATPDTAATWVRLLKTRRKDALLFDALQAPSEGREHPYRYKSTARRFLRLPECVYAYWMSDALLEHYATLPTLQKAVGKVFVGTQATPDFRFLRLAWEVPPARIGLDGRWPRFAKGGEYRPFWDDIHLVLNWEDNGAELTASPRAYIRNPRYYGRSGVTWPLRNQRLNLRVFPEGCCFSHKGPCAFAVRTDPRCLLAVVNSRPLLLLLAVRLGIGDEDPAAINPAFEVGIVKMLPWPGLSEQNAQDLSGSAVEAIALVRAGQLETDSTGESCVAFAVPPVLLTGRDLPLSHAARRRVEAREDRFGYLADITAEIDDIVADAYGFTKHDCQLMDEELEPAVARFPEPETETDPADNLFRTAYLTKEKLPGEHLPGGLDAEVDVRVEHRRGRQTKALRDEETLCRLFELPPRRLAAIRRRLGLLREEDMRRCAAYVVSWAVGVAFGRWDFRLLDHPEWIPGWPDPFGPLPRCPLGQLVDARGLPATPGRVGSETWLAARTDARSLPPSETANAEVGAGAYPVEVAWDGVLKDDKLDDAQAHHVEDLYRRTSQVLELVYGDAFLEREAELARALGAGSLGAWLRDPDGFFGDHLGRYSKSRRRAPIYWPLSTPSGGFTFWLYYPRLSGEMLAGCANWLDVNEEALLRKEAHQRAARGANGLEAEGEKRIATELRERAELREALRELTDRGFHPHLDDGAVINAAPLRRWFRNRTWREAAEQAWTEVTAGEHDWSHLAMWLRRDEVLERCRSERDLAIAHHREDLYVPPPENPRRRGRRKGATNQLTISGEVGDDDV